LVVWKLKNVVSYYKLGVAIGTIVVYDFPRETEQFLNCFLASSGSVFRMIFPVAMHCNYKSKHIVYLTILSFFVVLHFDNDIFNDL